MAPRKPPARKRSSAERIAMCALAWQVAKAQSQDLPIVLTLRERPPRKVRGVIEARRIDKHRRMTGRDGESNLLVVIAGEEIPLECIAEIHRQAVAPAA